MFIANGQFQKYADSISKDVSGYSVYFMHVCVGWGRRGEGGDDREDSVNSRGRGTGVRGGSGDRNMCNLFFIVHLTSKSVWCSLN